MSENTSSDSIYAKPLSKVSGFVFDEAVVDVFPDMIGRSVPGYGTTLSMLGVIAEHSAQPHSNLYDLGCSLGAGILSMNQRLSQPGCRIVGLDNSPAMVKRCQKNMRDAQGGAASIEIVCADILESTIENASVVVMNFTLQFIAKEKRKELLKTIFDGLLPGGVLVLSEKICFPSQAQQKLNEELHHQFKMANGYSELEISQKRTALENVLIPETIETHQQRLQAVGFSQSDTWFRCFNFVSLVAVKQ